MVVNSLSFILHRFLSHLSNELIPQVVKDSVAPILGVCLGEDCNHTQVLGWEMDLITQLSLVLDHSVHIFLSGKDLGRQITFC